MEASCRRTAELSCSPQLCAALIDDLQQSAYTRLSVFSVDESAFMPPVFVRASNKQAREKFFSLSLSHMRIKSKSIIPFDFVK